MNGVESRSREKTRDLMADTNASQVRKMGSGARRRGGLVVAAKSKKLKEKEKREAKETQVGGTRREDCRLASTNNSQCVL